MGITFVVGKVVIILGNKKYSCVLGAVYLGCSGRLTVYAIFLYNGTI